MFLCYLVSAIIVVVIWCSDAYAYIDPGTGALMWQAVVAALIGGLFYIKKVRDWFVTKIKSLRKSNDI